MRSTTEVFKLCCHTCNRTVELPANRQDARLAQLEKENKELGHCFIEVTYHRDADVNIIELWDAIEQVNEKAHWTQKFNMWIVTLPSGEDKNRKSEKEFNELVKAYMEE
jgi:hypothetical protein